MAWNFRRRRSASGLWAFIAQNPALALLVVAGGVLLGISKTQKELSLGLSGVADDLTASVMELVAGPANEGKRWIDGAGTFFSVYDENQRLRDENAKLRQAQSEVAELQRKVERYEQLLKVPTEAPVSGVAGRVIADMSGPFLRTILVNAGSDQGVLKGQAVVDDRGLLGRIVGTGRKSSRVLLLSDLNSRIPVIVEGANLKAILAGDNSDRPTLEYLPPGSRLVAGARVLTTADGGALPPGIVVGVVVKGQAAPRVELFTSERRADFVRVLKYQAPVDVDNEPEAPAPADAKPTTQGSGGTRPANRTQARPALMRSEGGSIQ
jgi:rod shape-determining protein MreC